MPLYEYRCSDCQHEFEIIQKISAGRLRKCPECTGRLEKLVSKSAFHLKGGGWYSDGYGGGSKGKKTKAPSATSTDKGKSDKSKSDKGSTGGSGSGSGSGSDSGGTKRACSA